MAEPLRLEGCTPEPLMGYLKALGVLRLLAEQVPKSAVRGWWEGDTFLLQSNLDEAGLRSFLLERYQPTPLVAPWGARSGFYPPPKAKPGKKPSDPESAARAALTAIEQSSLERLKPYQRVIRLVRDILRRLRLDAKAEEEEKVQLMQACRAELPDELIGWLDAVYVLTNDGRSFPPLLGTGGNEGSGSYVSGFAQMVVQAVLERKWDHAVDAALFGRSCQASYSDQTPGHFSPGDLGGTNPWDYLLALEGCCVWASGLVRRAGATAGGGVAAFPFTVRPVAAGGPALCGTDEKRPKGAKRDAAELWLPLWGRPSTVSEIRALFTEGRATVNRTAAETGLDFALAAASLGIDRGIEAFQRVAFFMRNGKSFFAASLGRTQVTHRPTAFLLEEVRTWLDRLRQKSHEKDTPARFGSVVRRIDAAIFEFCKYGGEDRLAGVLRALGNAERELAVGDFPPDKRRTRRPLGGLSSEWASACDDGSVEYRLARGVAFIASLADEKVPPLRAHLEPVERGKKGWVWAEQARAVVWSADSLPRNLGAILARRIHDGERAGEAVPPLSSLHPVSLADVSRFLAGQVDDLRLEELLWGFALAEAPTKGAAVAPVRGDGPADPLPRAYALLKLTLLPGRIGWLAAGERIVLRHFRKADGEEGVAVRPDPAMLARLRAGDVSGACEVAVRRLRAAGFVPLPGPWSDGSRRSVAFGQLSSERLLASLLFPINNQAVGVLGEMVLRVPSADSLM
jgi:CRISPR-associated protein Csx17